MSVIIAAGILLTLGILGTVYGIRTYNKLVSERLKVDNQWSQIDIVLKQRNDAIPNLVKIVSGCAVHEKELLENVTRARNQYLQAGTPEEAMQVAGALSEAMTGFFAVAENYPELKTNENFLQLQQAYLELEKKAADFRQFFNDTVMRYNRVVLSFPTSLIASMFRFAPRDFFQVSEDVSRPPEIRL